MKIFDKIHRRKGTSAIRTVKWIVFLLLSLGGFALGLYLGIGVMFIGGIIQIVNALPTSPIVAAEIAYGIARILFCPMAAIPAYTLFAIGTSIL